MSYRYNTYCGLYCGACEVLKANRNGTLETTARKWKMKAADLACHGCKSTVLSVYCRNCDIKNCARRMKVGHCVDCAKFPCERIIALNNDQSPHHSIVLKNLKEIGDVGASAWLRRQDRRWRCKNCGERFSWYAKRCGECGSSVYNSISEEKYLKKGRSQ